MVIEIQARHEEKKVELDGIWDLIESVSEGFLTYSCHFCTRHFALICSIILPRTIKIFRTVAGQCLGKKTLTLAQRHSFKRPDFSAGKPGSK